MKILVIDKSIFGEKLTPENQPFFKHLLFWHGGYNQVDLLARIDKKAGPNLKGKVNLIKFPFNNVIFNLFYTYFYLIFKTKKYDLVIEVWENKPSIPLIFNRNRSLVSIFGKNFKTILPGKIFSMVYGNIRFLVNCNSTLEKLLKVGIDNDSIKFIPDGSFNSKSPKLQIKKKNKISIICGKDVESVVSIINFIERKSLDWKFVVMADKKNIQMLKKMYEVSEIMGDLKIIPLSAAVFESNIKDSKFLIITGDATGKSDYILDAYQKNTVVFSEGNFQDSGEKRMRDLIISYNNEMDVAAKIISISKNETEYKKIQEKISKALKSFSWEEVEKLSLKFIESL